jgi:hypothetical protein
MKNVYLDTILSKTIGTIAAVPYEFYDSDKERALEIELELNRFIQILTDISAPETHFKVLNEMILNTNGNKTQCF